MSTSILNREFEHPTDGWYQIEAKGRHPNREAGVVQVIDDVATEGIVNRFNADAAAGQLRHGSEMLIDHEHFSDSPEQESRAYGWLQELQNRADGIYGRIRWTTTGQSAVDGGDYRFFSTEYLPSDLQVVKNTEKSGVVAVRPMRLAGLSLTNMNNNRGQKPITNRGEEFRRGPGGSPAATENQKQRTMMKSVASKLGLSAEASEETVLAEVTKLFNRMTTAEGQVQPLQTRVQALEADATVLLNEQIEADFATAGIKDDKIVNRHKPILADPKHFKNRAERVAFIADLGAANTANTANTATTGQEQHKLQNRDTKPPKDAKSNGVASQAEATKIMNRATELRKLTPSLSLATAVAQAQLESSTQD